MKSVSLHTLGCKLNYSETSTIAKDFSSKGYRLKEYGEPSDIFVLNTCSVTENADKECRQIVRSVIRSNPRTYIIVTGCYAQLQPQQIAGIEGVDLVLGINEKFKLFDYMDNFEKTELSCIHHTDINEVKDFDEAFSADTDSRTRAFLKIQDGCNYKCSFCTIPLARGKSRSLALNKVIDNAKKIIDSGYKEIVLTGVNTGDYNYEFGITNYESEFLKLNTQISDSINSKSGIPNSKLIDVLYELDKLDIERIRISSIEPNLLNDEIISLAKTSGKLCNHFHIPLQSGDNDILKLMRRRYDSEYYRELILKINQEIKDAGIGVDVIVGFPGETEKHFENTYNFLESLQISYLHVFSYSERSNTDAVNLSGRVDVRDRKRRSELLRNLSGKKRFDFYSKYTGTVQKVLFETRKNNDTIEGFTANYIKVKTNSNAGLENKIAEVKLVETDGIKSVKSELIEKNFIYA
ncbi:MAG TPA: MiaB/RimO family radical SAM methylthiotransferase [Ignavibacteria bacterium]|nr:MiaB/RimO family radical SAM methylthiotransferase [Ignavibacteria bacterium]